MRGDDMRKGHPVLGGFAGFFLFLFVAIDLVLFGVLPLNSPLITILPILGAIGGVLLGHFAPLGPKEAPAIVEASALAPPTSPPPPPPPSG
jgi:uncharacterized YccA/Bax inhibitor family protein